MTTATWCRAVLLLAIIGPLAACSGESVTTSGQPTMPAPPMVKHPHPDPPPEVADEITHVVQQWVAARVDENGVYDIPPRGGRDVAGTLAKLHAVRQKDSDTYTLSADFTDGDDTFEVTFFVDLKPEGLKVRDAYLHKVNGEIVSG